MNSVSLNQDYAVSASDDETVQVYSLAKMTTVHTLEHSSFVTCISFGPVNTWLANKIISCGGDNKVRIWNVENGKMEDEFSHEDTCKSFDIDKTATTLAVAYDSSGVSIWSIRDHKLMANFETNSVNHRKGGSFRGNAIDVRFNQSADTIAWECKSGEVHKITL